MTKTHKTSRRTTYQLPNWSVDVEAKRRDSGDLYYKVYFRDKYVGEVFRNPDFEEWGYYREQADSRLVWADTMEQALEYLMKDFDRWLSSLQERYLDAKRAYFKWKDYWPST